MARKFQKKEYRIVLLDPEAGFYAGKFKFTTNFAEAQVFTTSLEAYKMQKFLSVEFNTIMLKEVEYRLSK